MPLSLSEDFRSVAEFEEHPLEVLKQVRRTGRPVVVTRKGKPEAVVLDAAVFERHLQAANLGRLLAEAEADVKAGRVRPVEDFFRELDDAQDVSG